MNDFELRRAIQDAEAAYDKAVKDADKQVSGEVARGKLTSRQADALRANARAAAERNKNNAINSARGANARWKRDQARKKR